MERSAYDTIAALEAESWWYSARRELLERLLRRHGPFGRGLELGCGVGSNLPVLARHCGRALGIDASPEAVAWCQRRGLPEVRLGDIERLELADASADLVICMDVLEHVDDRRALSELRRVLRPGGLSVLSVPAHAYLWNDNDTLSHHRRRYSRRAFRDLLGEFQVLELGYWNQTMFLPALGYCLMRRLTGPGELKNNLERVPGPANRPLKWALSLENRARELLPTLQGTSLVALVRRG